MLELRPYQRKALEKVYDYWAAGGGNPLVDLATGLGKSVLIAELVKSAITAWPDMRVLMLVHVRELVRQNYLEMRALWPEAPIGIYSAGLNQRDGQAQIVFASVQSVYKRASLLGRRDLVIIDEAHLVPKDGSGMYRSLLTALREECPDMRVCGFTATPYRLDSGRLDKGDEKMFDEVVYSYGIAEGVEDFYLAPLHSRAGKVEIDVSNVGKRGGEFIASELESAAMDENIIARAAREIVERGADRRSWLIFCTGIAHAEMVAEAIKACGVEAVAVHSKMSREARDEATTAFKEGRLRCLTNAQVLTTGFNAPTTDLIAFLRPTLSTGLYVQMMGRGTRTAPGKDNCLVLDFSGNVRRHGPVDAVRPAEKRSGSGDKNEQGVKVDEDDQRAKTCPKCEHLVLKTDIVCKYCGHEWPAPPPKHAPKPDTDVAVMTRELPRGPAGSIRCTVYAWDAFRHEKYNDPLAPPTVRIQYRAGTSYYKEWLCPEHPIGSFPRRKFFEFWDEHGGGLPIPETVEEAIKRWDELKLPAAIFVKIGDQFPKIVGRSMIDEKKTA